MFPFRDLNSSIKLSWFQRETYGDITNVEYGNLINSLVWHSGAGYGQLNKSFFNTGVVLSGQNLQVDLFNLNRVIFGQTFTASFNGDNIKLFYLENTSTGTNQDLFFCATGQNSLTNLFSYSYLGHTIKSNSYVIFADRGDGASCDTDDRYFYLQDINGTGPIRYEIGIFGVST